MTAFTKVNLKRDVEDSAVAGGMSPSLEYRVGRDSLGSEESAVSYLRIAPGFRMPFGHAHETQEELYLLVSGSARLKLDDEVLELEPWDCVRIAPATVRNLEAGPAGAELVLVGAPKTGPGDAEMLPGWWREE